MPIVLDNENPDDIVARLVFDNDLFTIFFRKMSCGSGAEGEAFHQELNMHEVFRGYAPHIIINDFDLRHRHFRKNDTELSHVHIGFEFSIEHPAAVQAIIKSTATISDKLLPKWTELEKIFNKDLIAPICSTQFFSGEKALLAKAEKIFSKFVETMLVSNNKICFWGKSNGKLKTLPCEALTGDIPKESAILENMHTIVALSREFPQQPRITQDQNEKPIPFLELMILLVISMWLIRNMARPLLRMGFRK